jgi:hypothetical protein
MKSAFLANTTKRVGPSGAVFIFALLSVSLIYKMWWPFASKYPEHGATDVDALEFDYIIVGGIS